MAHKDEDDIGAQVSNRLEELFGEEDEEEEEETSQQQAGAPEPASGGSEPAESGEPSAPEEDSPLKDLKALVFGIDWEITDEGMRQFLEEVRNLQSHYSDDKVLATFLKMHESVGKYIGARKSRAHPEAFKFLSSVFKSFEKVVTNPGMPDTEKKRLLAEEIRSFKGFKHQLTSAAKQRRALARAEPETVYRQPSGSDRPEAAGQTAPSGQEDAGGKENEGAEVPGAQKPAAGIESREALDYIVSELRKTIREEFHTIRQIIKNLGA
ncbi:MAG: hypothetical protein ACLFN5_02555 [bacterium]